MREIEPILRRSLVGAFGPLDGRQATVDALAWAWENWPKVRGMNNPGGYLFRVGRTAAARERPRDVPKADFGQFVVDSNDDHVEPGLIAALAGLPSAQRSAVLLVHGHGYTLRAAAEILGRTPSTVHSECKRALSGLRKQLGVEDAS